ncbi:hypothetical protein EDC01DRAFT_627802 [Geopyxis carbonaria]|nr:hypothetical protein EDC01DRAFT_627802 [Geopyxis carbonaria]
MRPPPPSYPPPPPPSGMSVPAGYTVTLCGPPATVLQQQRLLPLSQNILCLPALKWTPPAQILAQESTSRPSSSRRASNLNPSSRLSKSSTGSQRSNTSEPSKPTLDQLKLSVLKLHDDYLKRHETAREFLEAPRGLTGSDRRLVFYNGGERDVKQVCIEGLKLSLGGDDEEVERVWFEVIEAGVDGLLEARDGGRTPKRRRESSNSNNSGWRYSTTESVSSDGKYPHNNDRKILHLNIDVPIPSSSFSPISPNYLRTPTTAVPSEGFSIGSPIETGKASEIHYTRGRGNTVIRRTSSPPPSLEEADENEAEKSNGSTQYDSEPETRTRRLDSAYSSGVDSMPTPPTSAEFKPSQITELHEFRFKNGEKNSSRSRSQSPTLSSEADSAPQIISPKQVPAEFEPPPVEPLFPSLREDLTIILLPDTTEEQRKTLVNRLLGDPTNTGASAPLSPPRRHTFDVTPAASPNPDGKQKFRHSVLAPQFRQSNMYSPPTLAPSTIHLFSEKSPLEVQNEVRALLTKYIPPANTADTPTSLEFPGASKWLLDSETDLFGPLISGGFEGLPEALCPSLDMIVAVGGDGREQRDIMLTDETERQAAGLARRLAESIEQLGGRGNADTRGIRAGLRCVLRIMMGYLGSHPGTTLEDVAAGHFLIPCMEAMIKINPNIRLFVVDFDLKTGSQAILSLKSILPPEMFKLIVVGEAATASSTHGHGNRIYVRTSVGKSTVSFSALPSPLLKEKPKIRRLESAKMSVLARADVAVSPWANKEGTDSAINVVKDGIRERRLTCGVINCESSRQLAPPPTLSLSPSPEDNPPGPPPSTPPPPTPPPKEVRHPERHTPSPDRVILDRAPSPEALRHNRVPSPEQRRVPSPEKISAPLHNAAGVQNYAMRNSPPLGRASPRIPSPSIAQLPTPAPTPSPAPTSTSRCRRGSKGSTDRKTTKLIALPPPPIQPPTTREPIRIQITPWEDTNPHPGVMMPMGRRDSDTNSHGGGVSISSPRKPPLSAPVHPGVDWREGSYFDDAGGIGEDDEDEYDELTARPTPRKGSKALRWLGLET